MGHWEYDYDANGNLIYQIDAKLQETFFLYDELSRIRQKDYQTQKPLDAGDIVYTYDELFSEHTKGRLTTLKDLSGTTKFYYDKLGRTTKTIKTVDSVNYTTETSYDALSRIDTVTYPDNTVLKYEYETGGNLLRVKDNSTGFVYAEYTGYNALGQIGRTDYGNGVNTIYQYLPQNNRLYSITTNKQANGLMNLRYSYDNGGNIANITDLIDSNRTRAYTYDALDRLIEAESQTYGGNIVYQYDKIGNMTYNCKYGHYYYEDAAHRHGVTEIKKTDGTLVDSYSYDANGNMTGGAGRTFTYDYDNRPTQITYGGGQTDSVYDASGWRVKKSMSGTTTVYIGKLYECTSGQCTKYIFAGSQRIAQLAGAEINYYHTDHLGSSSIITDAAGSKVEDLFYYPYGEIKDNITPPWANVNVKHKYTGHEYDGENGLIYAGARYYDPKLARFISADTVVPEPFNPQALNRYSYCINNPVIYTDPSGHSWLSENVSDKVSKVMDDWLGVEGVSGQACYWNVCLQGGLDLTEGQVRPTHAAIGIGQGGGVNLQFRSFDYSDSGPGSNWAVTVGYARGGGLYVSGNGGYKYVSGNAAYYFKHDVYQVGSGVGYGFTSVSASYSNVGGWSVGGKYAGVSYTYNIDSGDGRVGVDGSIFRYMAERSYAEAQADNVYQAPWYSGAGSEAQLTGSNVPAIREQLQVIADNFGFWYFKSNEISIGRYHAKFYDNNAKVLIHKDTIDGRVNPIGHLLVDYLGSYKQWY